VQDPVLKSFRWIMTGSAEKVTKSLSLWVRRSDSIEHIDTQKCLWRWSFIEWVSFMQQLRARSTETIYQRPEHFG
jgi:hypothetical protein